jgi:TonB-dependent SusC/RagA subfamily outer membrane receptor
MQKLIATLAVIIVLSINAFAQQWDRHMQVKKMDIRVKTDAFTATTFIEMEFYNPTETDMEGLYSFQLEPGQAITAFQLDLFGKFRDGSIEEKWKATNAYNTIVGKRVDPALLRMDSYNNYSLRIYPVPPKGSRRITMTIQQLLKLEKGIAIYTLPLQINDIIENLAVSIRINGCTGFPSVIKGLLTDQVFTIKENPYELFWLATGLKAEKPLSFSLPLSLQQPLLCIKKMEGKTFFALRLMPGIQKEYSFQPGKVTVFWDISATGRTRNIAKEISFLKQYVAVNMISQLTIIPFNHKIQDTAIFYTGNNFNSRWAEYLEAMQYDGATQYGVLDFSTANADAILLFSEGKNSYGKDMPVPGKTHIYCINSAYLADVTHLEKIIGQSGGKYIDLVSASIADAVVAAGKAENILLGISAAGTKPDINQKLSALKDDTLLLTGTIPAAAENITLSYGNNGKVQAEETIVLTADNSCEESAIERINMLSAFDSYNMYNSYWMDALTFGKKEKVVTIHTAFIVLEKVEDYIKFNITPPKELESQCDMKIFVKADEERRKQYKTLSEFETLTIVANSYNQRIAWWDKTQPMINLREEKHGDEKETDKDEQQPSKTKVAGASAKITSPEIKGDNIKAMEEVVVTAMGQTRQPKELGYSVSRVSAAELTQGRAVNLQNELTGKVSGLNIQTVNNGVFADTRITLRGIRSLTGNNQPMMILDGSPIPLSYISSINPNDIQYVNILKSPAATAIYGPDGVNGAIIIQTKRGSRYYYSSYWGRYKLKDREDVDYLVELKEAVYREKFSKYQELRKLFGYEPGFYFDAAQHFYEVGFQKDAMAILFSAADISNGNLQVQLAMGYVLESWKKYDEAIKLYTNLLVANENDFQTWRNLALTFYQKGDYQQAVDIFYQAITKVQDNNGYYNQTIKAMMLQEMNAVIVIHKERLDLSKINQQLIRPLEVDLRITLDCNNMDLFSNVLIMEPDGTTCSYIKPESEKGGKLTRNDSYYRGYYSDAPEEYQIKKAQNGKYKIKLNYSDSRGYYYDVKVPTVVKITLFKNFGKPDQTMVIENVIMDNQHGEVEIGEVIW